MKKTAIGLLVAGLAVAQGFAANTASKSSKTILKAGSYSAQIKGLTCSACAPAVEKTMKAFPGLEGVSVSQEKSAARFSVKTGATVNVAKLQAALKSASDEMGMGADYSLRDIKPRP